MKYLMILTVGICLLLTSVPAMAGQAEDEAGIRKAVEHFYAVANKHDRKAFSALFVEDYESWPGTLKGRAAFVDSVSDIWEHQKDRQYKTLEVLGIVFVTPDVAIYKDRQEVTGRLDADGKQLPPLKRLWAAVYVKKNDRWLVTAMFFDESIEQ